VLRGYADEHVAFPIVQALRARGMDVVTVQDRGREGADDAELLTDALSDERVMLTNDTDFLALAAEYAARGVAFAPVFFWPQQRRRIGEIVRRIIRQASGLHYATAQSRVYYL
jgi:hypothetical protein